jgi:hypothetical protein
MLVGPSYRVRVHLNELPAGQSPTKGARAAHQQSRGISSTVEKAKQGF